MAKQKEKIDVQTEVKKPEPIFWVSYEEAQKLISEEKLVKEIKVINDVKMYAFEKE